MMESILKTINCVNSTNYPFNKFLSASAWSSLYSDNFCKKYWQLTSLLEWCASLAQFQNLSSHYVVGHQVIESCTSKEYLNSRLLPHYGI